MSHALFSSILLAVIMAFGCRLATELAAATSGSIVPELQDSTVHLQVAQYPIGPIEDADGNLWLGSVGSGAMMWDGEELRYFHAEDGLVGDRVTGLTLDAAGQLWLVSAEGNMGGGSALMTWDGETLARAEHPAGFPINPVRPYFDNSGVLWVQSEGRFHREVNGVFEPFPLPE
ncbi:hypothetical protein N9L13_07790, partial [Flavobacteriales bacterium]|nr:hypothetical protein [Flavobacteriales bacterium]